MTRQQNGNNYQQKQHYFLRHKCTVGKLWENVLLLRFWCLQYLSLFKPNLKQCATAEQQNRDLLDLMQCVSHSLVYAWKIRFSELGFSLDDDEEEEGQIGHGVIKKSGCSLSS